MDSVEMLVFQEEGEPERPEKDTGTENQQQTQPIYGTELELNQWLTLMGGERSLTTVPLTLPDKNRCGEWRNVSIPVPNSSRDRGES